MQSELDAIDLAHGVSILGVNQVEQDALNDPAKYAELKELLVAAAGGS